MKLIDTKNLTKIYSNGEIKTEALININIAIEKGEFVAIMGPSGSGKSTLMQILGLLDHATKGEYFLEGENVEKFSDDKLADIRNIKIGFIFQTFNLLPRTTVYENVELPLLYGDKKSKEKKKEIIVNSLKSVGMEHRTEYFSNQLSGGERQRVAIARALVNKPNIIFADEPTGNLDSKSGLQIMKILQKLNKQGHTIVLVTHETHTAQHAQRILQMVDGEIISDKKVIERRMANESNSLK